MTKLLSLDPATSARFAHLLARTDAASLPELAAELLGVLRGPFFRTLPDARFAARDVNLDATSPTFPAATIVADGLDRGSHGGSASTVDLDHATFLSWPVLRANGQDYTVETILAAACASETLPKGTLPPVIACVRAIGRIVLDTIHAAGAPIDDLRPRLSHHTVAEGASVFISREAALNTIDIDARLNGGLTWAAAVKLIRPPKARHRVLYEIGDLEPGALLFTVGIWGDEGLHVLARLGSQAVLEVTTRVEGIFDRYVKFVAVVRGKPFAQLQLWIDDVLVGSARGGAADVRRLVGRQSIGAGIQGKYRSALFLRELVLVGAAIEPELRARLSRHLDRHTRRPYSG